MAWATDEDNNPYWLDDYVEETGNEEWTTDPNATPSEGGEFNEANLPAPEQMGAGPIALDGTIYTLNDDGSWSGDDGMTLTAAEMAQMQSYFDTDNESAAERERLDRYQAGQSGLGNITAGHATQDGNGFSLEGIAKSLGVLNKDGSLNWSNLLGLGSVATGLYSAATAPPPEQLKSPAELLAGIPTNTPPAWTASELAFGRRPMQTGTDLAHVYAADMSSPITPGKQYAEGGEVDGPLTQAFAGAVLGQDGGQSDLVTARLSPGEYVMDAESVSALGDGNTAAGVAKLDELRERLRAQKRSTPTGEIPPQAMGPLSYMQGE